MAVDAAQQMIGRNVIIEAEVVEELRRNRLTPHHSIRRKSMRRLNHDTKASATPSVFNTISPKGTLSTYWLDAAGGRLAQAWFILRRCPTSLPTRLR
ncbi:hypothetical protein [Rhizobium leguminosarum]|uniref:hypothetical protein n=1 Tax=Rhizobium leguminosarum TaxID=384 RepID=UPI003F99468F